MQVKSLTLQGRRQDGIPLLDHFLNRMRLGELLGKYIPHERHCQAILLLIKNVLIDHQALYAIRQWSQLYDPGLVYGGTMGDDVMARALDKLFACDRASLQTELILQVIQEFGIDTAQLHNDSTTVTVYGTYEGQKKKAIQLKRGHNKDHRPDLKQLVYSLTVTADGAVPIHFKTYDGNRTDDTTHWETWSTLRALFRSPDFLYVADSKLCVEKTMRQIDQEHGRFITVLPKTRGEVKAFYNEAYASIARWAYLTKRRCTRKKTEYDIFERAEGLYQTQEGFRIYWYRSSKKQERDRQDREERIDVAQERLARLAEEKRRGPKTEKSLAKSADAILQKYHVIDWITVKIQVEEIETFRQRTKGRPTPKALYRRIVQKKPRLLVKPNQEGIDRSKTIDGIFPLLTNQPLTALDTLNAYKYQPYLEKRHALLKTSLQAAPIWIKRNDRIEALALILFLAQLTSALIERETRQAMKRESITQLPSLPENRTSKTPTTDQIFKLFENRAYHILYDHDKPIKTFSDPLTPVQTDILNLLKIPKQDYLP